MYPVTHLKILTFQQRILTPHSIQDLSGHRPEWIKDTDKSQINYHVSDAVYVKPAWLYIQNQYQMCTAINSMAEAIQKAWM